MKGVRFGEGINVVPVLAPIDIAATATNTAYVDLDMANWITFLLQFGNMTSDTSDTVTITVEASSDGASSGDVTIPFRYRLSSAVATNAWGAITASTSDGAAILTAASDNMSVLVDVDPAACQTSDGMTDARWVRATITPLGPITLVSACAFVETRYPANAIPSSS